MKKYDIHIEFPGAPGSANQPPAPPPSKFRIALIITGIVLSLAMLTWLGIWFFSSDKTGPVAEKDMPPEMVVQGWYAALAKNQPEVLWNGLPEAMQKQAAERIQQFGQTVAQDAELYKRGVAVARNFTRLVETKKGVLLELMNYKPKQGGINPQNIGSIISSLTDDKAPGANIKLPDPNQLAAGLVDAQLAAIIQQYKVEAWKLDATAGILHTLLDSDLKNPAWLTNASPSNLVAFVKTTGGKLMEKLDAVPAQSTADSWQEGFKKPLSQLKVTAVSTKGDTAVVEVDHPQVPFLMLTAGKRQYTLQRTNGQWRMTGGDELVFSTVLASVDGVAAKAKQMESYKETASKLGLMGKGDRIAMLQGLEEVDKLIGEVSHVRDAEEFVGLLRRKVMGHLDVFMASEDNATRPPVTGVIVSGNIPKKQPGTGTNNATVTTDFSTVPATGPGRPIQWAIYDPNANNRYRIEAYVGQPESVLLKAFGRPDDVRDGYWVYQGMKVFDMRTRINCATAYFGVEKGFVRSVLCR